MNSVLQPARLGLLAASLLVPAALFAQPVISNVSFVQEPGDFGDTQVRVTYDLANPSPCFVALKFSANNGTSFVITPDALAGDFGYPVAPGTGKEIVWRISEDLSGWNLSDVVARVVGTDVQPNVALTITNSVGEGVATANASQTFTFTFDEPVIGFDVTDVTLSGATGGDFSKVNDYVYTLEVLETGGTVTASVPALATYTTTGNASAAASSSYFFQDTWTVTLPGDVPMELIRIPAGTFLMGSPEEELSRSGDEAQHEVTISQDFYLGKTEVTQAQWLAIYGTFPRAQQHGTNDNLAVHLVSHDEVMDASTGFMKLLNDHITATSQGPATVTLPSEAQWEYACRAGTTTRFSFGDGTSTGDLCELGGGREDHMWYCGNSGSSTQLVGQKLANAWGLHDMHGNVFEWCADWYGPYPGPPASGAARVGRGGGSLMPAAACRSAIRFSGAPNDADNSVGFRVLAMR